MREFSFWPAHVVRVGRDYPETDLFCHVGALTFKKGQVLGSDGEIHDGASPAQLEALIRRAEEDGEMAGVSGTNLYVVIDGEVTFVLRQVRALTS